MSEPSSAKPTPESDTETPEADAAEQRTPPRGAPETLPDGEIDAETPEADAAEQRTPAREEEQDSGLPDQIPLDADEADVADQSRVVEIDEDDYR